jgi:dolichol-phosphate mannosyltransferase
MPSFLSALKDCDVVMGSRFRGRIEDGAMSLVNGIGNRFLTTAASLLFLHGTSDLCTGMWGFRRDAYKSMDIGAGGFEVESTLFAQAVKRRLSICEIPIPYRKREGESKVRVSDGVRILCNLIRERFSS